MPDPTPPAVDPDDAAVLAGAEVEQPCDAAPAATHTTRTLDDVDPAIGSAEDYPLTTDQQAQDDDSIVDPEAS